MCFLFLCDSGAGDETRNTEQPFDANESSNIGVEIRSGSYSNVDSRITLCKRSKNIFLYVYFFLLPPFLCGSVENWKRNGDTQKNQMANERLRDAHVQTIQRASQLIHSSEMQEMNLELASSKLNMLNEAWHNFERAHFALIQEAENSRMAEILDVYAAVDDTYWQASSALSTRIQTLSSAVRGSVDGIAPAEASLLQFHLGNIAAPIKLPEFDGTFSQWASFRDSFIIDVIEDPRLGEAHKLKKLQHAVTG